MSAVDSQPLTMVPASAASGGITVLIGYPRCRVVVILAMGEERATTVATALFTH